MRVLLDENVPRKLKHRLTPDHEVVTVPEQGWAGLLNGALLRAADAEFDAFVTLDRGIVHQQTSPGSRSASSSSARSRIRTRTSSRSCLRSRPRWDVHGPARSFE